MPFFLPLTEVCFGRKTMSEETNSPFLSFQFYLSPWDSRGHIREPPAMCRQAGRPRNRRLCASPFPPGQLSVQTCLFAFTLTCSEAEWPTQTQRKEPRRGGSLQCWPESQLEPGTDRINGHVSRGERGHHRFPLFFSFLFIFC